MSQTLATPGKVRSVAAVIILIIVTLGIYGIVWGWKVTRELDNFGRPAKPSHPHYRKAVYFLLAALPLFFIAAAIIMATVGFANLNADPQAAIEGQVGAFVVAGLFIAVGAGLLVTACVFELMAMYKFTQTLEAEGRLRTPTAAANGTLLFVLFLLGILGSRYGSSILSIIAAALSQNALNKLWQAPRVAAVRPSMPLPAA